MEQGKDRIDIKPVYIEGERESTTSIKTRYCHFTILTTSC